MPGILEEIGTERRAERIASLRQRIAELRQKIAGYRVAKNAQKLGPEAGLTDFQLLAGMKPNEEPAQDQQPTIIPARGPIDTSRLAATAPSGPLAASSTGVVTPIPPRGDTIGAGPGIDYRAKIGATPDSWVNQEQEEVTGIGPLVRNLGREAIGLAKGIGKQVVDLAAASGPIANPAAANAVVEDLTGMVSASIDAIHNAGTAIGTNPFAGGFNPIIEHAKVWFDQNLSAADAKRRHEEIDRKYPDYAAARDQVDKNLFGTALGIVGIVAPLKGMIVPKPIDLVAGITGEGRAALAERQTALRTGRQDYRLQDARARAGEPAPTEAAGGIAKEGAAPGPAELQTSPVGPPPAGIPAPELPPEPSQLRAGSAISRRPQETAVRPETPEVSVPGLVKTVTKEITDEEFATISSKYNRGNQQSAVGAAAKSAKKTGEPRYVIPTANGFTIVKEEPTGFTKYWKITVDGNVVTGHLIDGMERQRALRTQPPTANEPPGAAALRMKREVQPKIDEVNAAKAATPETAVAEIIDGKRESSLGLKEFKRQMVVRIDEELKVAPPRSTSLNEVVDIYKRNLKATDRSWIKEEKRNAAIAELDAGMASTRQRMNVPTVTIEIPGDGTFKIEKTQEALSELKTRISGLREGTTRVAKFPAFVKTGESPTPKYTFDVPFDVLGEENMTVPIPSSPRNATSISTRNVEGTTAYVTDGCYFIKKTAIPDARLEKPTEPMTIPAKKLNDHAAKYLQQEIGSALEEVGRISGRDKAETAVFTDGNTRLEFNGYYVDFFHRNVKDFSLAFAKGEGAGEIPHALILSKGKPVGALMPIRLSAEAEAAIIKPIRAVTKSAKPPLAGEGGGGVEIVKPTMEAGGGVGTPGMTTSLGAKLGFEMRRQAAKTPDVSVEMAREMKKPSVARFFRRPLNFVEQFGQYAKQAQEKIVLAARDVQAEIWRRDNLMNEIKRQVPSQDWGVKGERFWKSFESRPIEEIMADPNLQPGTKTAAKQLRQFLDQDRTEQLQRIRERNRNWVTAEIEKQYRQEIGARGEPLGAEGDPARAEVARRVDARLKEMVPETWRIEDYLPHMFPGDYLVKIMNADGEFVTVGSATTRMEAMSKVAEVAHNMGITDAAQFQVINKGFSAPDVVRLGAGRYWSLLKEIKEAADISKADLQEAMKGKIGMRAARQKWAAPLQHRTGAEGFTKDMIRAMGLYNRSIARNIYTTKMGREVTPMIERIRGDNPQLADYLQSNFDAVWGTKRSALSEAFDASLQHIPGIRDFVSPFALERWTAAALKQPIVYLKWKLSPRAQLLNSLQLAQTGVKLTAPELAEGIRFAHTAEGHAAMKAHSVESFAGGRFLEFGKLRPTHMAGTETFNQRSAWSAFYRKGIKAGMDDAAANDYAYLKGNLESQFAYNPADVPPIMRGAIPSTILMFKRFTVNDLELGAGLLRNKNFPGAMKWLGAKLVIGGLKGATSPILAIGGGYLTHKMYQQISKEHGKGVADFLAYGLPGLIGLDMSYSLQMVDAPSENVLENLGPVGGDIQRYSRAIIGKDTAEPSVFKRLFNTAVQGNPGIGRLIDGLYKLGKGADRGLYNFNTPDGKLKYRADLKDLLIYALGGKTIGDKVLVLGRPINEPLDIWTDALVDAMAKRDAVLDRIAAQKMANPQYDAGPEAHRFNALYPEFPITNGAIDDRVEARKKSTTQNRAERMLQTAPTAIKKVFTPGGK
jgi:hypothetical protein